MQSLASPVERDAGGDYEVSIASRNLWGPLVLTQTEWTPAISSVATFHHWWQTETNKAILYRSLKSALAVWGAKYLLWFCVLCNTMGLSFSQIGFLQILDIGNTVSFSHAFYYFHLLIFYFMHKSVLSACVSIYHICAWCSWRSEVGIRSPRIGVMDSYEPLYGYWKLNPGSFQEQVILTGEPSH